MKKFFVAVCCTLMLGVSVMAQDATPPVPVEDVAAVQEAVPAPAPVAESSVMQAAPYGTVINSGCANCGGNAVMSTPMTYTMSPCGCAPVQTPCCGQAAPAVATDCCAPVDPCCCDNGGRQRRVRTAFTSIRGRRAARTSCCCN